MDNITLKEICALVNISYNEDDYDFDNEDDDVESTAETILSVEPVINLEAENILPINEKSELQQRDIEDEEQASGNEDVPDDDKDWHSDSSREAITDDIDEDKDESGTEAEAGNVEGVLERPRGAGNEEPDSDTTGIQPRRADPEKWTRKTNQQARKQGREYKGKKGGNAGEYVTKEPRHMGPPCNSDQCAKRKNRQCSELDDNSRQLIFSNFWSTMDWEARKVYVSGLVDIKSVHRHTSSRNQSRRKSSLFYHLKVPGGDSRKPVCKGMFLSTLGFGEWTVHSWTKGDGKDMPVDDSIQENEPRQRTPTRNQQPSKSVKEFLEKLPKLPSHYCRRSSTKLYIQPDITSMSQLYNLYKIDCLENDTKPACRVLMSKYFRDMNLSLFQPRKDQCDTCCAHKAGNLSDVELLEHRKHVQDARDAKQKDKDSADEKTLVLTMDLQALLLCPRLEASALFYKTKLGVHNFTLYNMGDSTVVCYVWHESEGGLTASEFTSCVMDFLKANDQFATYIIWSDGCGYQNRNGVLSNALLSFAKTNGKTVIQKYLERGHTQMEVDSVHSTIERKLKHKEVYCPSQYASIFREARSKPCPYNVKYLEYSFFKKLRCLK